MLLNEGDPYNQRYFDLSLLRLNQLGYFNEIKDTDADIRTNRRTTRSTSTSAFRRRAVSRSSSRAACPGVGGSFIGLQYSTNNLLGYGESLTFDVQAGDQTKHFPFGFTEPYLFGPADLGRASSSSTRTTSTSAGRAARLGFAPTTLELLLGLRHERRGALHARRRWAGASRVGRRSYFFKRSTRGALHPARPLLHVSRQLDRGPGGEPRRRPDERHPRHLPSRRASRSRRVTPSLTYNSLNSGLDPTRGQSLSARRCA